MLSIIVIITLLPSQSLSGELQNPYDVFKRFFRANGGLERLKAEKTSYFEGEISVAGLKGTVRAWSQKPDRYRTDVDLKVFKMSEGDNGRVKWVLDSNGKLQLITNPDQAAIKRKEVRRRIAEYEYAYPQSEVFSVKLEGVKEVDGRDCYVVRIDNNINKDYLAYYISVVDFMLEKAVYKEDIESRDEYYGDYRDVDGIMVAFWNKQVSHQTGQTQEITVTKYESNPEIDPSVFDPPEQPGKDYHFTRGSSAENIPIEFMESHLYIPVTVDCRERLWIIDSGAAMSVISRKLSGELGLKLEGDLKGMGAGGTVNIQLTALPPFDIKGIHFDRQTVAVIDMVELNRFLDSEIVGILGYDFLSRFVTKIDYARKLISFYDPETFEYHGDGNEVDVHIKNNVFMVEATLEGKYSGTWLFDLGAAGISLNGIFANKHEFPKRKGVERIGRGAANTFVSKGVRCSDIEFGGYKIDNPIVTFGAGVTDTNFTADEIGILGNTLFRNFIIYCDYTNECLIVEKGDDFNKPVPVDRSGLQLVRNDNDEYEVFHVVEGTPADKGGFAAGDIFKSINGIDVEYLEGLGSLRKLLREKPGTEYKFTVQRDGKDKKIKLKLKDLY
jgi:hypothetical protein